MPPTTLGSTSIWRRTSRPERAPDRVGQAFLELLVQRCCDARRRRSHAGGAARPGWPARPRAWIVVRPRGARTTFSTSWTVTGLALPASSDCTRSRLLSTGRTGSDRAVPRVGRALDDPGEAEQLVLDLVEGAGPSGLLERRLGAEDLHSIDQVPRGRPARAGDDPKHGEASRADPRLEERAQQREAGCRIGSCVAEGAGQPGFLAEQPGDGEQLGRRGRDRRVVGRCELRVESLAGPGKRLAACAPHLAGHRWLAAGGPLVRSGFAGLEVLDEPLDHAALARVVAQRLTDDPTGELDGDLAHLVAQLGDDLLALRLEPRLLAGGDAVGLLLGALAQLLDDRLALRAGLVADARGVACASGRVPRGTRSPQRRAAPWPRDRPRSACGSSPAAPSSPC